MSFDPKALGHPWKVYPEGADAPGYFICNRVISDGWTGLTAADPMPDALAYLIAAAPSLHAILETLEEQFDTAIFPEREQADFEQPAEDHLYTVTLTHGQWRRINDALNRVRVKS